MDMDWTLIGGFVALAALMVGLFRDVKGDVRELRRDFEALRTETREAHAQTGKQVEDLRTDARQWVDDLRTETRQGMEDLRTDLRAEMRQGMDDLRAENRAAHAQTGKRLDDMHATLLAIVPRAAAEPADRA